ncbi:hypothetical protein GCM10022200_13590 [Microbacterium awajiense]|uniref:Restriction endonuclease type IV Mrr domain-containing protein n=1 Tax=Microbacterium awajiense TaxID=415214 RepID=A0ABP7AH46_9MICO
MVHARLRFALEQLGSGDWQLFERFCSEFLIPDFPALRTTATPSGDKGRDGELFALSGVARTGFQYSVTASWKSKIRDTVKTAESNGLGYSRLIYCTSQAIGAQADDLVAELWDDHGIVLDIRDREWFCERETSAPERAVAAEELCAQIVDPIVSSRGIATATGAALSSEDARVAMVQLALNESDRFGDKNLTKTSFDALVQSVLVGTSQDDTLDEAKIVARMCELVPHGASNQVAELTRSSLTRLSRKHGPVKHRTSEGKYHLAFEASERWKDAAASYLLDQEALEADLAAAAYGFDAALDGDFDQLKAEARKLRVALERIMLVSGERFAAAVDGAQASFLSADEISEQFSGMDIDFRLHPKQAAAAVLEVIASPSEQTHRHLVRVLDAYTLMAFLHQTPDVQKALARVFDNAKVWLDTSALLPLVAERLIDDPTERSQTNLLAAAVASGVSLFVTDGVIEELRFHVERCIAYINRNGRWNGGLPFLYSAYMLSGRDESEFSNWATDIRGPVHPEHDIEEFLEEEFGIRRYDLRDVADKADVALRGATDELFRRKHTRYDRGQSSNVVDRLAAHDVENAVGVIELRRGTRPALGHEIWWLTLDKTAFKLSTWLKDALGRDAPDTPALSPDYLSQLLRLGPLRRNVGAEAEHLPLVVDVTRLESVPLELIEVARKTRESMQGMDERRIRREVRDAVFKAKTAMKARHDYAEDAHSKVLDGITGSGKHR